LEWRSTLAKKEVSGECHSELTCTTAELSMSVSIGHIDPNCFEAIAWFYFSFKQLARQKSAIFVIILLSRNIFVGLRSR
jgi:hypothetical protein